MPHHCCRLRLLEARVNGSSVKIEPIERIVRYSYRGVSDPVLEALRGDAYLRIILSCSTFCVAEHYGEAGEALRASSGSVAHIEYERRDGAERLVVEGVEAELRSEAGRLQLHASHAFRPEELEPCTPGEAARVIAERLTGELRRGVPVYNGGLLDYARLLSAAMLNMIARRVASLGASRSSCIEDVVSRKLWEDAAPLLAGALLLSDYLARSIVAYPLDPYLSLIPGELGDYGRGLWHLVERRHREVLSLASRLAGMDVELYGVNPRGAAVAPGVWLQHSLRVSPPVALAVSLAASLVDRRSIILAIDAPVEQLDRRVLLEELERSNSVLVYTRF